METKKELTDYDKQAQEFVEKTALYIGKTYLGHRKYFPDDKEQRAVWEIEFIIHTPPRGHISYVFEFGQSIQDSYKIHDPNIGSLGRARELNQRDYQLKGFKEAAANGGGKIQELFKLFPVKIPPTDYDILACIEKHDPGSFEDFCAELGYDTDSRKALDIFNTVDKQWHEIEKMFTEPELELLREIN